MNQTTNDFPVRLRPAGRVEMYRVAKVLSDSIRAPLGTVWCDSPERAVLLAIKRHGMSFRYRVTDAAGRRVW